MAQFQQYLESVQPKIKIEAAELGKKWLNEIKKETSTTQELQSIFSWVQKTGNCLRGSLVLLAFQSYDTGSFGQALRLAGILELLQTALLIHDDIMDQSKYRRGSLSMPEKINQYFINHGQSDHKHKSIKVSLAVGDHLITWIQKELIDLTSQAANPQIIKIFNTYLSQTMGGQITDVCNQKINHDIDSIKDLYVKKTATYTYCLPFVIGQTLAKNNTLLSEEIMLEVLGENLGIILQSQDDLSGFNDSEKALLELREDIYNQQVSLWLPLLLKKTNHSETSFIIQLHQTKIVIDADLYHLRFLAQKYNLRELVSAQIRTETRVCHQLISELTIKPTLAPIWHSLVDYTQSSYRN